jgi:hypothetical protein
MQAVSRVLRVYLSEIDGGSYQAASPSASSPSSPLSSASSSSSPRGAPGAARARRSVYRPCHTPESSALVTSVIVSAVRAACARHRVRASVHWPLTGLTFGDETPAEALFLACRSVENADVFIGWECVRASTGSGTRSQRDSQRPRRPNGGAGGDSDNSDNSDDDVDENDANNQNNINNSNKDERALNGDLPRGPGDSDSDADSATQGSVAAAIANVQRRRQRRAVLTGPVTLVPVPRQDDGGTGHDDAPAMHEAFNVAARVYPAVRRVINRPWGVVEAAVAASDDGGALQSAVRYVLADPAETGQQPRAISSADSAQLSAEQALTEAVINASSGDAADAGALPGWLAELEHRVALQITEALHSLFPNPGAVPARAPGNPDQVSTSGRNNTSSGNPKKHYPKTYDQRQRERHAELSRWHVYRATYARALLDPLLPYITKLPAHLRTLMITSQRGGGKSTTVAGWVSRHRELRGRANDPDVAAAAEAEAAGERAAYRQPTTADERALHAGHLVLSHVTATANRGPRVSEVLTYFLTRLLQIEENVLGRRAPETGGGSDDAAAVPRVLPGLLFDTDTPLASRRLIDEFRAACYRTARRLYRRPHFPEDERDNDAAGRRPPGPGATSGDGSVVLLLFCFCFCFF